MPIQTFWTHDNGGRPFRVVTDGRHVDVFERSHPGWQTRPMDYQTHVASFADVVVYAPAWGTGKHRADGNSILLQVSAEPDELAYVYAWIGDSIWHFGTSEPIESFHSPIGNNDVPYPYGLGEAHVYLIAERVAVPKRLYPADTDWSQVDPYDVYYDLGISFLDRTYDYRLLRDRDAVGKPLRKPVAGRRPLVETARKPPGKKKTAKVAKPKSARQKTAKKKAAEQKTAKVAKKKVAKQKTAKAAKKKTAKVARKKTAKVARKKTAKAATKKRATKKQATKRQASVGGAYRVVTSPHFEARKPMTVVFDHDDYDKVLEAFRAEVKRRLKSNPENVNVMVVSAKTGQAMVMTPTSRPT